LAHRDLSTLTHIGIDEVWRKRGLVYVTNVYDLHTRALLWSGEGRAQRTLRAFFDFLSAERTAQLQGICCDMWQPYITSTESRRAARCFPSQFWGPEVDEVIAKLTPRQRELLGHLERSRESGLSMRAFAEREGLKVQDLYTAKQALKRKGLFGGHLRGRARFARVQFEASVIASGGSLCLVRLANGCCVEISCPANPEAWRAVPSAVATLP
jgi:hypothetical protein